MNRKFLESPINDMVDQRVRDKIKELEESNKELRKAVRSLQIAVNGLGIQHGYNLNLHKMEKLKLGVHDIEIKDLIEE